MSRYDLNTEVSPRKSKLGSMATQRLVQTRSVVGQFVKVQRKDDEKDTVRKKNCRTIVLKQMFWRKKIRWTAYFIVHKKDV